MILHPINPIFSKDSTILILGSFPSIKSRETMFYYGNVQNRFWTVLASIYNEEIPKTIKDKKLFLLNHNIALWDVIQSCEINGSSDNTISNVKTNDIYSIINQTKVKAIFLNGNTAYKLFRKHFLKNITLPCCYLPSTSSANAKYRINDLITAWSIIKNYN